MAKKQIKLQDTKIIAFKGIQENAAPLMDSNSVLLCTNLVRNVKAGIFTQRPLYYLRYPVPVDDLGRILNPSYVSFDNFYDKVVTEGTEITIEVQPSTIQAPDSIRAAHGVNYNFNSVNIWMRPYWNGGIFIDDWQWLNETIITKLSDHPNPVYLNNMTVWGAFGIDFTGWTMINITKDPTLPTAVLASKDNPSGQPGISSVVISNYTNNWAQGDTVVLMKNYIPLSYLTQMCDVKQSEISFHHLSSKLRIGFGGKANRIALGVEYVSGCLQMNNYDFPNNDPLIVGKELNFAAFGKFVVRPYIQFNDAGKDFQLQVLTISGSFPVTTPGPTYYFRMTGVLDGINEVLLSDTSITITAASDFFPIPIIRSGSFLRRLTDIKVYFGQDNGTGQIDYYLFKDYTFILDGNKITAANWTLRDDGYFIYSQPSSISTNIYTSDDSAATPTNNNSIGSFQQNPGSVYDYETILVTGSSAVL